MNNGKKIIGIILVLMIFAGLFGNIEGSAKEITIPVPKIKVKSIKNGTGIKISISKTKDAEGYELSWSYEGNPISRSLYELYGYTNGCGPYQYGFMDDSEYSYWGEYIFGYYDNYLTNSFVDSPYMINKNGKAKRSVTLTNLQPGKYNFKIRSYNNTKFGSQRWSEYGNKSITLKGKKDTTGYLSYYDFSEVKQGDIIKFGTYEQDKNYTNGKEPIEWIVLSKGKNKIFIVSMYAIDRLPYDADLKNNSDGSTWESCTIRKWLNQSFINFAFNGVEKEMIKEVTIDNYDNAEYDTSGGEDTKDRVFLLSQLDMINSSYGFEQNYDRDFDRACSFSWKRDGKHNCEWWLRTPGANSFLASYVDSNGMVRGFGSGKTNVKGIFDDYDDRSAVRPAMYISLKSGNAENNKKQEDSTNIKAYNFDKTKVGDVIKFGSYEQDNNLKNGKEEIEWIVLEKDEKKMMVISKYVLDSLKYGGTTWENSDLRSWINRIFFNSAFNEVEKQMIVESELNNDLNSYVDNDEVGNATKDKVFLLSINEINKTEYGFDLEYYKSDINRRCAPTDYAISQGAKVGYYSYTTIEGNKTCGWYLRSPGMWSGTRLWCGVDDDGTVLTGFGLEAGIRPVIYISLESRA